MGNSAYGPFAECVREIVPHEAGRCALSRSVGDRCLFDCLDRIDAAMGLARRVVDKSLPAGNRSLRPDSRAADATLCRAGGDQFEPPRGRPNLLGVSAHHVRLRPVAAALCDTRFLRNEMAGSLAKNPCAPERFLSSGRSWKRSGCRVTSGLLSGRRRKAFSPVSGRRPRLLREPRAAVLPSPAPPS